MRIAVMLLIGAMVVVGCYIKKKGTTNKTSMLALPTRSPAVSRNPSTACISPGVSQTFSNDDIEAHENPIKHTKDNMSDTSQHEGASSGGLMEQIKTLSVKSKKSKMSKYGELDE